MPQDVLNALAKYPQEYQVAQDLTKTAVDIPSSSELDSISSAIQAAGFPLVIAFAMQ